MFKISADQMILCHYYFAYNVIGDLTLKQCIGMSQKQLFTFTADKFNEDCGFLQIENFFVIILI